MAVPVPGLDLSIVRGSVQTQSGQAVPISGRFTAFGIGVPAFIRVFLEGPDYNPETTHFDTTSAPFSGDYSVQVIPSKDGNYKVYSQASPLPFLPPVAESTQPPLVVGAPAAGGVNAQTPSGTQFLSTPAQTPIEISMGAPIVSIAQPAAAVPTYAAAPTPPAMPAAAIPTTYIIPAAKEIPGITTPVTPTVAPVVVYPPYYPEVPTAPAVEVPTVPEVPEIPEVPGVTLEIPTFPSLPSAGMLGAPTSDLPSQLTIDT